MYFNYSTSFKKESKRTAKEIPAYAGRTVKKKMRISLKKGIPNDTSLSYFEKKTQWTAKGNPTYAGNTVENKKNVSFF